MTGVGRDRAQVYARTQAEHLKNRAVGIGCRAIQLERLSDWLKSDAGNVPSYIEEILYDMIANYSPYR